jgi:hypothetical protein
MKKLFKRFISNCEFSHLLIFIWVILSLSYIISCFGYIAVRVINDSIPPKLLAPTEMYYCEKHNKLAVKAYNYIDISTAEKGCKCNKKYWFIYDNSDEMFDKLKLKWQICSKVLNLREEDLVKFFAWYETNKNTKFYIMTRKVKIFNTLITSESEIDLTELDTVKVFKNSYEITEILPVYPEEIKNGSYIGNRNDYFKYELKEIDPVNFYALTLTKYFF